MEILKSFGYGLNDKGDYVYQSRSSQTQTDKRQNAANEFQKFYNDLKKIKEGSLNGFEEFINVNISFDFEFQLIFLNSENVRPSIVRI